MRADPMTCGERTSGFSRSMGLTHTASRFLGLESSRLVGLDSCPVHLHGLTVLAQVAKTAPSTKKVSNTTTTWYRP